MDWLPLILFWSAAAVLVLGGATRLFVLVGHLRRVLRENVIRARFSPLIAPLMLLVPALVGLATVHRVELVTEQAEALARGFTIVAILAGTWFFGRLLGTAVESFLAQHDVSARDNLRARRVHTRYLVIARIAHVALWALGLGAVATTVPAVREFGNGLLASAGIAGLVIGLAAQRTIGNFLAGIQIALTQPIRLDDAVVIAGEWGWIEDITPTYVVVKIWDERRLIVPFNALLEQPFQNWTRTRADLLGQVGLWLDYRVPLAALRVELQRIVAETDLWDGRVAVLQAIDCSERAVQVRALVSAADSPTAWDLRCFVRERLIDFLQREHPEALPTVRAEVQRPASGASGESEPPQQPEVGGLPGAPESESVDGEKLG